MLVMFTTFFKRLKKQLSSKQMHCFTENVRIEECQNNYLVLLGILTICTILIALIIWAALIHIEETAVTVGELVPKNKVTIAQHLEGGIISQINVKNGDLVEQGQILLELDPVANLSELEKMQAKSLALLFEVRRLRHYLHENFGDFSSEEFGGQEVPLSKISDKESVIAMIQEEQLFLKTQNDARKAQRDVLNAQIARQGEALKQYREQQKVISERLGLLKRELKISSDLLKDELVAEKEHIKVLRDFNQAKGELAHVTGEYNKTQKEYVETKLRMKELDYGLREAAFQKLVQLDSELLQTQKAIKKLDDRVERLHIRSPVSGRVKGIEINLGEVVTPGGSMMEIVPKDSELIVEARIEAKDIGHVYVGEPVKVKVNTYDYSRYGAIDGKLENISATTFKDEEEGTPYYLGEIHLKHQNLVSDGKKYELLPGMSVQADIITGDKTLLQYLFKPINTAMSSAFTER